MPFETSGHEMCDIVAFYIRSSRFFKVTAIIEADALSSCRFLNADNEGESSAQNAPDRKLIQRLPVGNGTFNGAKTVGVSIKASPTSEKSVTVLSKQVWMIYDRLTR